MTRIFVAIIIFALAPYVTEAQQNTQLTDSLKNALQKHTTEDTAKVELLLLVSDAVTHQTPDEAMLYADKALALSQKIKWKDGIAMSFRQQGAIYYVIPDYLKSLSSFQQALKAAAHMKDKLFDGSILNNMAMIYTDLAQYDKALDYYNRFLTDLRELKITMQESIVLNNMGLTYSRLNDFPHALASYNEGLAIAEKNQYVQVAAYHLNGIAGIQNKQGDYKNAVHSFEKSIKYAEAAGDDDIKAGSLQGLGESFLLLKEYDKAEQYSKLSLKISDELSLLQKQKDSYEILSTVYEKQQKPADALRAYKKFIVLRDSILNTEKKQEITRREMAFEFEKKEALLKAANDKKQLQAAEEIKRQHIIRNALVTGVTLLLLAAFISFILYKKKRDAQGRLKEAELKTEIADTEMKALRAQMNPHFIFNSLNSINDYISKHDTDTATIYTTKFARLMRMILENSEQPEISLADDLAALELYMQLEALRLHNNFTYSIHIDDAIDKENTLVPPLILQPFIENSIWHGIARKEGKGMITITILASGEMINCIIEDNGIGRAGAAIGRDTDGPPDKSLGTRITFDRINILNKTRKTAATVAVSDPKEGTRVEIKLPLTTIF